MITNVKKIKKITFAILAAPSAIFPNPNIAATIAMMKKIADHFNMIEKI